MYFNTQRKLRKHYTTVNYYADKTPHITPGIQIRYERKMNV